MLTSASRSSLSAILARNAAIEDAMSGVLALETALSALSARPPALESLVPYDLDKLERDFPFLKSVFCCRCCSCVDFVATAAALR